ncbi:MAG TPA: bifunctional UDP-3-O-[3-hydroxymyristoyl] N-acetylglucosamine deacetylase/3-hydroxyacyl-ACP dehydratase [Gemmatimonadaceae bacterium]|nr:bifunctional UDP-3-O-[3-hydroxymyristoyl] N-acetylglucosamine deacetylase/3-hydroxyacyl-ACP dehydratase [Gemmatimonadaceae bacterium]
MSERRQSIAEPVTLEGVGIHLGEQCRLTFRPAEGGTGIVFRRLDLPDRPCIPALVEHAVESERRTQIGTGERALHTVEHVLAAVVGHEIDDLLIEMDAPEPPILDGSAKPFFEALSRAGIAERPGDVHYLDLRVPLSVTNGESAYDVFPAPSLSMKVTIEFAHPLVGRQTGEYRVTPSSFEAELAPARTFGFIREAEALRARGLIKGASAENSIVLDDVGVVGAPLRWGDEFVRHKALDCVGDLALAGKRVRARMIAVRPSHRGTVALVRQMVTLAARETPMLGIEDIMKILPHRYPFLLVDRIVEIEERRRVVGIKNVTINEPFFQGHFPGHPIMPGVLIIEAMAQVGGVLLLGTVDDPDRKVVYFMSLDHVKWRKPVRPGDQLRFELEMTQIRGRVCRMHGIAKVDGEVVAEADMAAMVRDK